MGLLDIQGLTVRFGGLHAVKEFSLSVQPKEIHALIGPNGAGKSTVFNAISRLVRPSAGSICFEQQDLMKCGPDRIVSMGIARTFQNLELFRNLTVADNLLVGAHHRGRTNLVSGALWLPTVAREEDKLLHEALDILDFLGIKTYAFGPARSLPYGIQKLVELGRALLSKPRLLLLDEPAAGMNDAEKSMLKAMIKAIRDDMGIAVLLVEHDMGFVMELSEKVSVMNFGHLISSGTPDEVRRDPKVISAYLGEGDDDA